METTTQNIPCKVIRRTSKYNPRIKWFTECYREDGTVLSCHGYRTRKEAENELVDDSVGIPIGDKIVKSHYVRLP